MRFLLFFACPGPFALTETAISTISFIPVTAKARGECRGRKEPLALTETVLLAENLILVSAKGAGAVGRC